MVQQLRNAKQPAPAAAQQPGAVGLNLIGNRRVTGDGAVTRKIWNPADASELVAAVQEASAEQVKEAVNAAASEIIRAFIGEPASNRRKTTFAAGDDLPF